MDNRIWAADAIASPPSAPVSPSAGYPTDGDPLAAQNATEPGAYWFHAFGEEMRAVIVEGGLTPNASILTQIRDAIKNIVKGGDYKDSVRVASTAAINLAAPGANIDGIAMVAGDRFLEKDNATSANRGIYIWNGSAVPATRALDADTGAELNGGAIIPVEAGTVNADTNWQVTNDGVVVIGTTGLTFQQVGSAVDATTAVKGKVRLAQSSGFTGTGSTTDVPPVAAIIAGLLGAGGNTVNDYITLPYRDKTDGSLKNLIIQWVTGTLDPANNTQPTQTLVLPITFPNAALSHFASCEVTSAGEGDYWYQTYGASLSGISVQRQVSATATTTTQSKPRIFLIGN